MNLFQLLFGTHQAQQPARSITRQPIAHDHGSNKTAGQTTRRQDVADRLGVATRFGGRHGNARGSR